MPKPGRDWAKTNKNHSLNLFGILVQKPDIKYYQTESIRSLNYTIKSGFYFTNLRMVK